MPNVSSGTQGVDGTALMGWDITGYPQVSQGLEAKNMY